MRKQREQQVRTINGSTILELIKPAHEQQTVRPDPTRSKDTTPDPNCHKLRGTPTLAAAEEANCHQLTSGRCVKEQQYMWLFLHFSSHSPSESKNTNTESAWIHCLGIRYVHQHTDQTPAVIQEPTQSNYVEYNLDLARLKSWKHFQLCCAYPVLHNPKHDCLSLPHVRENMHHVQASPSHVTGRLHLGLKKYWNCLRRSVLMRNLLQCNCISMMSVKVTTCRFLILKESPATHIIMPKAHCFVEVNFHVMIHVGKGVALPHIPT